MTSISPETVARARSVPIETIIEQRGIKLRGRIERIGPCPKCGGDDRFAINTIKRVFNCRQCEASGDVIELVRFLDGSDFVSAVCTLTGEKPKANGKLRFNTKAREILVSKHDYPDASGAVAFVVERREFQNPDNTFVLKDGKRKKTFKQKRPDPDRPGAWIPNVEGVPTLPYRLPELIEAISYERPIVIVEGEAKADRLWTWGVAATCNAGGAGKWKAEHSAFLKGADVVLCPDHDDAGWKHVNAVGAALAGIAKSIRVIVLHGLRPKGDVIDWIEAGGTRAQLDTLIANATEWQAPPPGKDDQPEKNDDDKAKAKAREDELLDALAKTEGLEYARQRKAAAEELEVSARDIDLEVRSRREDMQVAPLYGHWIVEPWPDPADGDSLLRDIIKRIQRHVVIEYHNALAVALWLMLSWVHDEIATHSPILNINSAEPESGKSTTMGLISFLMPKCIASVEASEAAIYRAIKRWEPSFCFDEFDSILASDDKAALRSVINSGHVRGQGVLRCIGDDRVPELFPTFAPKAIGIVGRRLPPATLSRCIFIELRRRKKAEVIEAFTHTDDPELADLRRRLRRWAMDNDEALRGARPAMPEELANRTADNWRLQLAIADLCSGIEDFGDKARAAATTIESKADNRTSRAKALAACKEIFDAKDQEVLFSDDLIAELTKNADSDWAEWRNGKPITQAQLARLLKPYGIIPERVKIGELRKRGYVRAWFVEAWETYL
jgi:hypothetical protein